MLDRRILLAAVLGLNLARPAAEAAEVIAQTPEGEATNKLFLEALYLPALRVFLDKTEREGGAAAWSQLGILQAMLGREEDAFRSMARAEVRYGDSHRSDSGSWRSALDGAKATDALAAIREAARGRRIVILNEAHHVPRCRSFAAQVARSLRVQGFSHFAAEAFSLASALPPLASRLTPLTPNAGYLLLEPMFAELVREVRDSWAECHAYEASIEKLRMGGSAKEQIAIREEAQADALAELLRGYPEARLFIYCGYSHAAKTPVGGNSLMAHRLKLKTGLDPLTITQAFGAPASDPTLSPDGVEDVLDAFHPKKPIVVRRADGGALTPVPNSGAYDLAVYHPRQPDKGGRPGWLSQLPDRRRISVEVLPRAGYQLVQAIPADELRSSPNAIPADQILVEKQRGAVQLFLRPGRYDICIETEMGRVMLGRRDVD